RDFAVSLALAATAAAGLATAIAGAKFLGLGAETLAMAAAAAPIVALAAAVGVLAKGLYDYKSALDSLHSSEKEQGDSLATLEISLRQQGVDISDLSTKYNSGLISQQAYIKG